MSGFLPISTLLGGSLLTKRVSWLPGFSSPQDVLVPAQGAKLRVFLPDSSTPVSVFPNDDGSGSPLAQPLTADADGLFAGYVAQPAQLDFAVSGAGLLARTIKGGIPPSSSSTAVQLFGAPEFYGHSHTYGGSSDGLRGMDARLAYLFGAEGRNRTKGGAALSWHEQSPYSTVGNAGWAHIYRWTDNLQPSFANTQAALAAQGAGLFEAKRDFAMLWFGWEDIALNGPANLTPFQNALTAAISRLRAAAVFEEDDSSVTYPTGTWVQTAGGSEPTKYQSGASYMQSDGAGGSVRIAVPASFPGGTAALAFLCDPSGHGAAWSFTVDGAAAGTLEGRAVNAKDYLTGANGKWTPVVKRLTELAPGAHTIVATTTAVATNALFDCWWAEGRTSPLIVLCHALRLLSYSIFTGGAWPYVPGDGDATTIDAAIDAVAAVFDGDVITASPDSVIGKTAGYYNADQAHLNDEGHALVAEYLLGVIVAQGRSTSKHAAGGVHSLLTRNPIDPYRNIIQVAAPDQSALTLYGRNAGDQTAALLNLYSRGATAGMTIALGRTAVDATIGVVGKPDDYLTGTSAGDLALRPVTTGRALWLGVNAAPVIQVGGTQLASGPAMYITGAGAQFNAPIVIRSQVSGSAGYLMLGRTANEAQFGVAANAADILSTSQSGDTALRAITGGKALRLGVSSSELLALAVAGSLFTSQSASAVVLAIKAFAAQSGDLLQLQDSSGAPLLNFTAAGTITQYEYAFSRWDTLPQKFGFAPSISTDTNQAYVIYYGGKVTVNSANSGAAAFYYDPADTAAGSRTNKVRIRVSAINNGVAPATSFTVGLYPVTWGTPSGGNPPTIASLGSAVATVTFTTPAAGSATVTSSADVNAPAAGWYAFAVTPAAAPAANSSTQFMPVVQSRQV